MVLPHILRDFGFVEQYPRRWRFNADEETVVFELDEADDGRLRLTWLSEEPENDDKIMLRGQLTRLLEIKSYVTEGLVGTDVTDHERETIMEFYGAMVTALEYAIWGDGRERGFGENEDDCSAKEDQTCSSNVNGAARKLPYDALEERPEVPTPFNDGIISPHSNWDQCSYVETVQSHYQAHTFEKCILSRDGGEDYVETCLSINDHQNVCSSLRPHYHEVFVHYPARFLPAGGVRRVLFMGGGDNMVLHELLKYPNLEKVVGLELDQAIVRSTARHFGTSPHWDDPRVEWWFGDATASVRMLPASYFGSFDLVLIDLQSDVVDFLRVNVDWAEINIIEAAKLLLSPTGIIVRNVDYGFDTIPLSGLMAHAADIYYVDVPIFGFQGITMGSDTIDFFTADQMDHGIGTLYLEPLRESDRLKRWYNYRNDAAATTRSNDVRDCCNRTSGLAGSTTGDTGVLMVLEVEGVVTTVAASISSVLVALGRALGDAGLTEVATTESPGGGQAVIVMEEGYVVVRFQSELGYCAADVVLWSRFELIDAVGAAIVEAAGGGGEVSSYRFVTGGMLGTASDEASDRCKGCGSDDGGDAGPAAKDDNVEDVNVDPAGVRMAIDAAIAGSLPSLIHDDANSNGVVVIVCGELSELHTCGTLDELERSQGSAAISAIKPVYTCPGLSEAHANEGELEEATIFALMSACEKEIYRTLTKMVRTSPNGEGRRIAGIVISPEVPKRMGQVLHGLFSAVWARRELGMLTGGYVVVAPEAVPTATTGQPLSSWRRALLDRLRTDIAVMDPAHRAEVIVHGSAPEGTVRVNLGVFSAGDRQFFPHLAHAVAAIETAPGLLAEVRRVVNGQNEYVSEFKPSLIVTPEDYGHNSRHVSKDRTRVLGQQTLFKFNLLPLSTSQVTEALASTLLSIGTIVGSGTDGPVTVGNGFVRVVFLQEGGGSIVASWDGRNTMSLNLFTTDVSRIFHEDFAKKFSTGLGASLAVELKVTMQEEVPRGTRVANFDNGEDTEIYHWLPEETASEEEEDDDYYDSEEEDDDDY
eukprot:CAMPEP_0194266524 /NCGR_PEP_ID=MMETSP0169-20130528/1400_1 /TAXON_ID=218684 /ORGANISM="Corethron pennatum, Strain L29A3" /LENGTH=1041 /DNA_ID=CAMNT_0039007227 /DNA_START=59 /DNA_END=3184 /DNA_ORIENTATION=+